MNEIECLSQEGVKVENQNFLILAIFCLKLLKMPYLAI